MIFVGEKCVQRLLTQENMFGGKYLEDVVISKLLTWPFFNWWKPKMWELMNMVDNFFFFPPSAFNNQRTFIRASHLRFVPILSLRFATEYYKITSGRAGILHRIAKYIDITPQISFSFFLWISLLELWFAAENSKHFSFWRISLRRGRFHNTRNIWNSKSKFSWKGVNQPSWIVQSFQRRFIFTSFRYFSILCFKCSS